MVEGDFFIRFAFFEPPPSAALLLLATFLLPFEEPFRDRLMLDDLGELLRRWLPLPLLLLLPASLTKFAPCTGWGFASAVMFCCCARTIVAVFVVAAGPAAAVIAVHISDESEHKKDDWENKRKN